jgi:sodium-dependent phosphate transporter
VPALRWYHFFFGPLLWKRPTPEDAGKDMSHITDYRVVKDDQHPTTASATSPSLQPSETETEAIDAEPSTKEKDLEGQNANHVVPNQPAPLQALEQAHPYAEDWYAPINAWIFLR